MIRLLKHLASFLPFNMIQDLKRYYFRFKIKTGRFISDEIEFTLVKRWVDEGDWVIDIGANVGTYTLLFSKLAGANGRVIAFEPVPDTFELLVANCTRAKHKNVTLINGAVSDKVSQLGFEIPDASDTGLKDYYRAHVSEKPSNLNVLGLPLSVLDFPHKIRLVKIDAEEHELFILKAMDDLLKRDKPILIVEDEGTEVADFLSGYGYTGKQAKGAWNVVFSCPENPAS